jgi:leucine-rich repeat protein SHOC2
MTMQLRRLLKRVLIVLSILFIIIFSAGYYKLRLLKSEQTYFDELEEALDNPERAETLVLRNRKMVTLPSEISKLHHLKVLNIGNNNLKNLPPEVGLLQNLTELNIENNLLTSIPKEIFQLKNLKKINLNHNSLNVFPAEIPVSVEEVYINNNAIELIPPYIERLSHLKIIDLAENKIVVINENVHFPLSIHNVDLFFNGLKHAPAHLFLLPAMQELILEENPLDQETDDLYKKFEQR